MKNRTIFIARNSASASSPVLHAQCRPPDFCNGPLMGERFSLIRLDSIRSDLRHTMPPRSLVFNSAFLSLTPDRSRQLAPRLLDPPELEHPVLLVVLPTPWHHSLETWAERLAALPWAR